MNSSGKRKREQNNKIKKQKTNQFLFVFFNLNNNFVKNAQLNFPLNKLFKKLIYFKLKNNEKRTIIPFS